MIRLHVTTGCFNSLKCIEMSWSRSRTRNCLKLFRISRSLLFMFNHSQLNRFFHVDNISRSFRRLIFGSFLQRGLIGLQNPFRFVNGQIWRLEILTTREPHEELPFVFLVNLGSVLFGSVSQCDSGVDSVSMTESISDSEIRFHKTVYDVSVWSLG
ncbi:hypothetical protein [Bacillus phage PK2]|nr:hypothetical protein [Bacillus phage PK2]